MGLPDDPASRWLLHLADKDIGGKRRADIAFARRCAGLREFISQGRPAGGPLLFDLVAARRYPPFQHHSGQGKAHQRSADGTAHRLWEVDILITDGWDAPWSRITYEEVPFPEIYEHIKNLQPNCLLCDLNASQYPSGGLYYSDVKAFEQNAGQKVPEDSDVPALSCVTLTDGWFWKQRDSNGHLKAVTTVVDEWLEPLNRRHCNLILNAPPTREGRLAPNVMSRLEEIGKAWKHPGPMAKLSEHVVITTRNLAKGKPIHASSYPDTVGPDEANDGDFGSSWYLDEGQTSGWLELDLRKQESFNVVSLVEPVGGWDDYPQSRIRSYRFQAWNDARWFTLTGGETPAPTTILRVPRVSSQRVRLLLEGSKQMPHIAEIGVYDEPA